MYFFSILLPRCLMNLSFWNHYKQNEKEKRSPRFHLSRQSTLEAAAAEIINETHSCDLSKWTGNKSLLIGPRQGWRQGDGCGFPSEEDGASWKLQVSRETLGASQGGQSKPDDPSVVVETRSSELRKTGIVCSLRIMSV